jgi:hypothetical protein
VSAADMISWRAESVTDEVLVKMKAPGSVGGLTRVDLNSPQDTCTYAAERGLVS